jgi:TRAP-type C4-dicarboxylate transport system permease large subunit
MNVFVIKGMAKDVSLGAIFVGVLPFVIAQVILISILVSVPEIALWLPQSMH